MPVAPEESRQESVPTEAGLGCCPASAARRPLISSPRMRVQGAIAKTELVAVSRLGLVLVAFALVPGLAFAGQGGPQRYKPVAKDVRWAKDSVLHSEDVPLQYRRDPGRYAGVMLPQCPGYYAPDRSDFIGTGTAEAYFRSGNSGLGSLSRSLRAKRRLGSGGSVSLRTVTSPAWPGSWPLMPAAALRRGSSARAGSA